MFNQLHGTRRVEVKLSLVSIPVQDPIKAHEIYTSKLGFISKKFDEQAQLAIVVSAEDEAGTAMLLEPCLGSFAENYQKTAFESNLPIMIFSVKSIEAELERLQAAGVQLRPELNNPDWGPMGIFEDGCGNLLMIQEEAEA